MIKLNLNETYKHNSVDLLNMTFHSPCIDQPDTLMKVELQEHPDSQFKDVYNMAFGPLNEKNKLDDTAKIKHADTDKMFSTVLVFGLMFLQKYPG